VDAAGDLLISDTLNQRLLQSSLPQLVFAATGIGIAGPPQSVTLSNTGTAAIAVTSTYSGNFSSAEGSTCGLANIQLQAGASCTLNIAFLPAAVGPLSGAVTFSGASLASQSILLSGVGVQTGTTVSLSSSTVQSLMGQAVTFAVSVVSAGSVVPTGTVSFYDGASLIGSAQTLLAGAASLTTTALSTGTHNITAIYSGDSDFSQNSSQALVQTVIDFSFAPASTGSSGSGGSVQTVAPGQAATYSFNVQPIGGSLTSPISLSATGLPPGATAVFSPQVITVGVNPTSFTMTVQTGTVVAALIHGRTSGMISIAGCLLLLPFSSWLRNWRRGGIALGCVVILSCVPLLALTGCAAANGPSAQSQQSYSIQVIGTVSGGVSLQHVATVTLTLQ